jgi:hypothetical protein
LESPTKAQESVNPPRASKTSRFIFMLAVPFFAFGEPRKRSQRFPERSIVCQRFAYWLTGTDTAVTHPLVGGLVEPVSAWNSIT